MEFYFRRNLISILFGHDRVKRPGRLIERCGDGFGKIKQRGHIAENDEFVER